MLLLLLFAVLTACHVPMLCGILTIFISLYDGGLLSTVALMDTRGRLSTSVHLTIIRVLFLEATRACGWPSRVSSDCGGENIEVARCMTSTRGLGRHGHLASSSVHNQRRRDTFRCICHFYYSLF